MEVGMEEGIERVVVWFSAGVTSAVAGKIALDVYGGRLPVHLVNCDTGSEDEDNHRFARDVSEWLGVKVEVIRSETYTDTFDVYRRAGFVNQHGAKCTVVLKKVPRRKYENLATDLQVFGYDADERARADSFVENNPEVRVWFPLIEQGITKNEARQMLSAAGIAEPRTYSEGFKNANCLNSGCVKGGMGYWNHIRKVRPAVFERMARLEREIGRSVCSVAQEVEGEMVKVPLYLDELPPHWGNYKTEPAFQCGLFCSWES
jgi:PP-loop superfamily ATP-utilizing enzyme